MTRALHILIVATAAVALTACGDDSDTYEYGDFRYDMVTYTGRQSGCSVFTRIDRDDAGEVTLVTTDSCYISADPGQRMVLNYVPAGDEADGIVPITAQGYSVAITDTLLATSREVLSTLAMDSVKLRSIWRTGDYINIYCQVKYTTDSRYLALVADQLTLRSDTVHCYLYHDMLDQTAYFWRLCYMSFYVGGAWNLAATKTLRLHITDVTYPDVAYYDFTKD